MLLDVQNLRKNYTRGHQKIEALRGVSFHLDKGAFISIMGPSGSGKSTLLHMLGGLDRPSGGHVKIAGENIDSYSDDQLSLFRRRKLGFIFQFFNLLPTLTALENVALPMLLDGQSIKRVSPRATELLELIGLKDRIDHRPDELSGGEMQRVAIARALVTDPLLILADEPTGNLDSKSGAIVLELLSRMVRERGQTILMVTHDSKAASYGNRQIKMRDGTIESDSKKSAANVETKKKPMRNLFRFVGLRHLRFRPVRSTLTTLGVALGVALYVAIQTINHSTLDSFRESIESISGKASLTVLAGETGFPESQAEVVAKIPGVAHAVPMVETRAYFAGAAAHESLSILGVDLLKEQSVRTYKTTDEEVIDDPLVFLNQPDSVILTHVFANDHGLKVDSKFDIATADGKKTLTVRGLLSPEGAAKAYGGALAIMDIDGAQATFGKNGRLDRVDVVVKEGQDVDEVALKIRAVLGAAYQVEKPEGQIAGKEKLVHSYQTMLAFFSTLALMVGLFFVTNSVAISVAERRREIGVLRALGCGRRGILALFISEAVAIGVVGSVLGVILGRVMAGFLMETVNSSISMQYLTPIKATHLVFGFAEIAKGMVIGVGAAGLAALWPSFKATAIHPLEAMKRLEVSQLAGRGGMFGITVWIGALSLIYLKCSSLFLWGTKNAFLENCTEILGIVGPALVGPGVVALLILIFRWGAIRVGGTVTRLAQDNLLQNPKRTGSNVMTLMVGLILVIIIAVINASFKQSISTWFDQILRSDILVSSYGRLVAYNVQPIREKIGRELEKLPGVRHGPDRGAYGLRFVHVAYEGKQLGMKAWDEPDPRDKYGLFATIDRPPSEAGYALYHSGEPTVLVSENLALHFHKKAGDTLELPTPNGMINFKVAGIAIDFASPEGVIYIDRAVYKKFWNDSLVDGFGISADKGTTPQQLRKLIDTTFGEKDNLMTMSNSEMKEDINRSIDEGFQYTRAIEGAALLVALLSLLNTFLISVMERTRELGVLRALGMSRVQMTGLIIQEALVQGGFGAAVAVALGAWIAQLWIAGSMSHTLGWIIHFFFPWPAILTTVLTGIAVTLVAGVYPAWRAAHLEIREALEYE